VLPVVEGRFGLIRVFRHAIRDYCWEVVRGFVDAGETPTTAALRELREEAGLDAAAGALTDLGVVAPEPGLLDARVRLFVAENCAPGRAMPGNEIGHGEMRYYTREALAEMIGRGEIVDPCTLVCCWRYLSPLAPGITPRAPA
jgi:ADP-ribose pyrophosphatase